MKANPASYPVVGDNGQPLVCVDAFEGGVWSEFGRVHLTKTANEARKYAAALNAAADVADALAAQKAAS